MTEATVLSVLVARDLTATRVMAIAKGRETALTFSEALSVMSGRTSIEVPTSAVADHVEAEFARYRAITTRQSVTACNRGRARVVLGAPAYAQPTADAGDDRHSVGDLATANASLVQKIGGLRAQLEIALKRLELSDLLIQAVGVADGLPPVLAELERFDPDDLEDVRCWVDGDGARWLRRPSGQSNLWLEV